MVPPPPPGSPLQAMSEVLQLRRGDGSGLGYRFQSTVVQLEVRLLAGGGGGVAGAEWRASLCVGLLWGAESGEYVIEA